MDIETIRINQGVYCQILQESKELRETGLYEIAVNENEYIKHLLERLRWKKVEEEKPEIGKKVLIKGVDGDIKIASLEEFNPNIGGYFWLGVALENYYRFPEWREI